MIKRMIMVACAAAALSGCTGFGGVSSPATIANRTTVDEIAGKLVTLSYTAASRAAALAIRIGIIKDPATIRHIGDLDTKAFGIVMAVRAAYLAGNAADYGTALKEAEAAIADLFKTSAAPGLAAIMAPPSTHIDMTGLVAPYNAALGGAEAAHHDLQSAA